MICDNCKWDCKNNRDECPFFKEKKMELTPFSFKDVKAYTDIASFYIEPDSFTIDHVFTINRDSSSA